jgi:hypothetical protein
MIYFSFSVGEDHRDVGKAGSSHRFSALVVAHLAGGRDTGCMVIAVWSRPWAGVDAALPSHRLTRGGLR